MGYMMYLWFDQYFLVQNNIEKDAKDFWLQVWGLRWCLISISSLVKTGPWTTQHYTALCRGKCRLVLLDLVIHLYVYALFSICLNFWRIRGGRWIIRTCYICERVTLHLEIFFQPSTYTMVVWTCSGMTGTPESPLPLGHDEFYLFTFVVDRALHFVHCLVSSAMKHMKHPTTLFHEPRSCRRYCTTSRVLRRWTLALELSYATCFLWLRWQIWLPQFSFFAVRSLLRRGYGSWTKLERSARSTIW